MANYIDDTTTTGHDSSAVKWDELSPAIQALYATFQNHQRDKNKGTLLVFYDMWFNSLNFFAVDKFSYVWAERDRLSKVRPEMYHALIMALDLNKPFLQQIPDRFHKSLERFECFVQTPLICIADAVGRIPSEERDMFEINAIWPKPVVAWHNPEAPYTPLARRSREHLRTV